ncbi:MAG TPA: hypothetical protein VFW65_31950 [Pseudonocardiaceae bacterium]|nr:hypothetical protein [Pseudonocardiaceae bacterium]
MPHPFSTPWLEFADTVRVYCCLAGIMLCVLAGGFAVVHTRQSGRILAALALAVLAASAIGTEFDHLGTHVTYRLWTNTIGVMIGLIGMSVMMHTERARRAAS